MPGEYDIGNHPSDLELRVRGKTLEELFLTAARAVRDFVASRPASGRPARRMISLSAPNREELLVAWLNEVLFRLQVERIKFSSFEFHKLSATGLRVSASGRKAGPSAFRGGVEIKAATYHDLTIRKTPRGWEAHIILDL